MEIFFKPLVKTQQIKNPQSKWLNKIKLNIVKEQQIKKNYMKINKKWIPIEIINMISIKIFNFRINKIINTNIKQNSKFNKVNNQNNFSFKLKFRDFHYRKLQVLKVINSLVFFNQALINIIIKQILKIKTFFKKSKIKEKWKQIKSNIQLNIKGFHLITGFNNS